MLDEEIENCFPDYSIYPSFNKAIGFLTRGCIRKCPWCIVPHKEGYIRPNAKWQDIVRQDSNLLTFMDNNILACDYGIEQIEELGHTKYKIDFNQGLDARLIDKSVAKALANVKWEKYLRVACDSSDMLPVIEQARAYLLEAGLPKTKMFAYCLIKDVEEAHKRIVAVENMGINAFAQPYRDFEGGEPTKEQKRLARWCNMKATMKSCKFEDYNK